MKSLNVKLSKHAIKDCLPLRFGLVLENPSARVVNVEIDEAGSAKQKPAEIKSGIKHCLGDLEQGGIVIQETLRFAIAFSQKPHQEHTVVSVMLPNTFVATRGVSELIRNLRERGKYTPEKIKSELHPFYKNGDMADEGALVDRLVELGFSDAKNEFERIKLELDFKVEEMQEKINLQENDLLLQNETIQLKDDVISSQDNVISGQEELINAQKVRIQTLESNDPKYQGESIEIAPAMKLKKVTAGTRQNAKGKTVRCTFLEFYDTSIIRKMDQWADQDGEKTRLAESLIGEIVITSTWKPEIFGALEWFRNIYKADSIKIKKTQERYSEERVASVIFVEKERVNLWYDFYTEDWQKYSTKFAEIGEQIILNKPMLIRYKVDFLSNELRIMGFD